MENVTNIRICTRSFGHFLLAVDPDFPQFHITSEVVSSRESAELLAREADGHPVRDFGWTRNARAERLASELWGAK